MERSPKQKINKDIVALNKSLYQMAFIDIYRAFHPKEAKYTFFLNVYGELSKIDHMVGHKTSPNILKKIEIMSNIFIDHNGLKLETNLMGKKLKNIQINGD